MSQPTTPVSGPKTIAPVVSATLQLQESESTLSTAPSLSAFLELAFRPLYLGAVAWAMISVAIWIYAPYLLTGTLTSIAWHAHEMLWGFIATIALAFLMTAGASWTGINPLKGAWLALAGILWLLARLGFLLGGDTVFWLAMAAELAFFLLGAVSMMRSVIRSKNVRNAAVPVMLAGLGVADVLYLLAARSGDFALLMQRFNAGLLVMALLALLIARRVIPFFAMSAIKGLTLPRHTRLGQVQLGFGSLAIVFLLLGLPLPLAAALGVTGLMSLWQIASWKPYAVRVNPLLWILYIGYASLGVGLLLAAAQAAGVAMQNALPVHVNAMAGFSVLIIGMVTRTALGHLGRPLATDSSMVVSYVLVLLAVVLRLVAIAPLAISALLLQLSAAAWILAMALYLWRFTPLMIRPRLK